MIEFDQFVESLGPHAQRYTPEQLRQLHIEVRKLAQLLIAVHKARAKSKRRRSSQQSSLDVGGTDRTIKPEITEHADDSTASHPLQQ